jgi:hypothetical protein
LNLVLVACDVSKVRRAHDISRGVPVTRSKANTCPCLVTCATAFTRRPSTRRSQPPATEEARDRGHHHAKGLHPFERLGCGAVHVDEDPAAVANWNLSISSVIGAQRVFQITARASAR